MSEQFKTPSKDKKYHTVGTIPKSNRKIVEKGKLDTCTGCSTNIYDSSLSWLGNGTSIKQNGGVKLQWTKVFARFQFTLYISYKTTVFQNIILKLIHVRF